VHAVLPHIAAQHAPVRNKMSFEMK
jgi:hypothetical protein